MKTPYFPIYVNDDLADASCLSLEEYGAYTRLRCHAWKEEPPGTLPDDDTELSRKAGVSLSKWQEMKPGVMRLFKIGGDGRWHHASLRQAFEKVRQISKAGEANVKKRWEKEREKKSDSNTGEDRAKYGGSTGVAPEDSMSDVISQNQLLRQNARDLLAINEIDIIEALEDVVIRYYSFAAIDPVLDRQIKTATGRLMLAGATVERLEEFLSSRHKMPLLLYLSSNYQEWAASIPSKVIQHPSAPRQTFCGECAHGWLPSLPGQAGARRCPCVAQKEATA